MLNDEEINVRIEAIDTIIDLMGVIDDSDKIEKDFIPVVKKQQMADFDTQCTKRMAASFGKMLFSFSSNKLVKANEKDFMCFFQKICNFHVSGVREEAVFNLPCVYYLFSDTKLIDFADITRNFSEDGQLEIRKTLAKCFHELVSMMSKEL